MTVRECRAGVGHPAAGVRIFASPEVSGSYAAGPYPLPTGALLVAAEYADAGCGALTGLAAMRKEPVDGGAAWHWQRLDSQWRVLEDGAPGPCVTCHRACTPDRDRLCGG